MFNICKTHRSHSQLTALYSKLKIIQLNRNYSHFVCKPKPINPINPRNHYLNCSYFSTKVKVENNNDLFDRQINQLNTTKSLVLFCPKWDQMYDVFYSGAQLQSQQQISDKKQKTIKSQVKTKHEINIESNLNTDNKSINLLNTSEDWKPIERLNSQSLVKYYTQLAKLRLTGLVVLTTLAGYYMGLQGSIDPYLLTATLMGTALTSGSATAINQYLEIPFDSQMKRTQNRPLVLAKISPLHAVGFAAVTGVTGLTLLSLVNPLTACLGATNLVLYSFIYTPMKRAHIANTWVGAVVGAIPPVMGFTAVNNCIDISAILMGLILYSWQFPHFNALSWNMRHEYARAGFRMMSVTEPKLCLNTALRHSCLIAVYSTLMCTTLTTWTFGADSLLINAYLIYLSWKFRSNPNSKTSRKLFFYSLIHLPAIIVFMCISKRRDNNNSNNLSPNSDNSQLVAISS